MAVIAASQTAIWSLWFSISGSCDRSGRSSTGPVVVSARRLALHRVEQTAAAGFGRVRRRRVDLVTDVLDIENVGDQIEL